MFQIGGRDQLADTYRLARTANHNPVHPHRFTGCQRASGNFLLGGNGSGKPHETPAIVHLLAGGMIAQGHEQIVVWMNPQHIARHTELSAER
jgi:hypothetical protein